MEYKIIGAQHAYQLEAQINKLAEDSWEVHSLAVDNGYIVIMQRLT